jgi:hypothetical protein
MIPCAVSTKFQARVLDLCPKPPAGGKMRLTEGGTVHTAITG